MPTVADYIGLHREAIVARFVSWVRAQQEAQGLSDAEVVDTLPEYLDGLAARSSGQPYDPAATRQRLEETHIGLRLRSGFRQVQVVEEYVQLAGILSALWAGVPQAEQPLADDVQRLHDMLQDAMEHATRVFGDFSVEDRQLERRTLRRLEEATAGIFAEDASATFTEVLQAYLAILLEAVDADGGAFWMLDGSGRQLVFAAGAGRLRDVAPHATDVDADGFLGEVARTELGVQVADATLAGAPVDPTLQCSGLRALFGQRLYPFGKLVGVLVLGRSPATQFDPRVRRLLGILIERLSATIDRTRLFDSLRGTHARFRSLLDSTQQGVYGIDTEGRCSFANAACARLFGVADAAALLGQPMHALTHHTRADGSPYPESECPLRGVLDRDAPVTLDQTLLWRADGSAFPAECHAAPIHHGGSVTGVVVTVTDLTDRQRQVQLAERLERWADALDESLHALAEAGADSSRPLHAAVVLNRAVLENALDAVIGMDEKGRAIDWNAQAEALFGWPREQALGRAVSELIIPARYRARHDRALERYLATGEGPILGRRIEVSALARDGREFPVELTVTALPSRRVNLFYAFVRDISEQQRLQQERAAAVEQLQHTLRLNESFMGVLAHDLRNPLAAILTGASVLRRLPDAKAAALAERIASSGQRMGRMIEQLLDVSRARQGGGFPVVRERMDLAQVCREVVGELATVQADRDIALEARGDSSGEWDPDRLGQVVSNLVGNALQHGPADTRVRVVIDGSAADLVELGVCNSGLIPEDVLPILFEPFSGSRRDQGGRQGLGLGLYITREIVRAHGGSISVDSAPSAGVTRFLVRLPRRAA